MKRTPKQTAEYLLKTLPSHTHSDLGQLLIATDDAQHLLAELEKAQVIIHNMVQLLTNEQKHALYRQHFDQDLLGHDGGVFRYTNRTEVIARGRRIHGDAK